MADIELKASLDTSNVTTGIKGMSSTHAGMTKSMIADVQRLERENRKLAIQQEKTRTAMAATAGGSRAAGSVRGGGLGGRNASFIAGQAAMQAQDIAVQMQMGTRYATILAQQGSQLLSFFGPKGMILGGVLAIGAAIYSWASGTAKADAEAKKFAETLRQLQDASGINKNARIKEIEAAMGPEAAEAEALKLNFRDAVNSLPMDMDPGARAANIAALQREYLAEKAILDKRKQDKEDQRELARGDLVQLKEDMAFRAGSRGEAAQELEQVNRIKELARVEGMTPAQRKAEKAAAKQNDKNLRRAVLRDMDREEREAMIKEQDPNRRSRMADINRKRMSPDERRKELEKRINEAKKDKEAVVKLADENIKEIAGEIAKANERLLAK